MKLVSYGFSIHQSYSHTEIIKISFKAFFFFFLTGGISPNALLQVSFLEKWMFIQFGLLLAPHPTPPATAALGGLGDAWEGGRLLSSSTPSIGPPQVRWSTLCLQLLRAGSPRPRAGSEVASCLDSGPPPGSKPSLRTYHPQPGHLKLPQECFFCTVTYT